MNRKLHNTASALFASAGLLVLSLMAANPMPVAGVDSRPLAEASADSKVERVEAAESTPRTGASQRKPRRSHQSVAMPFFSFAPRG